MNVKKAPIKEIKIVEVTQEELNILKKSNNTNVYLNFALPLLMLGITSLIRLLAIDLQGEFIWFLDFNLSIIGLLGGTLLLVLWKKGNQHQKEVLDTVQERINNST